MRISNCVGMVEYGVNAVLVIKNLKVLQIGLKVSTFQFHYETFLNKMAFILLHRP